MAIAAKPAVKAAVKAAPAKNAPAKKKGKQSFQQFEANTT